MIKFSNSCISGIGGPIDIEQKGWESVIHDPGHDLLVTKVRCKDLLDSDQGDFRCQGVVDLSCLKSNCLDVNVRYDSFQNSWHYMSRLSPLSVHPKRSSCSISLWISAISLKFGGVMHSTMEQIAIKNGLAQPFFACYSELWNFPW